MSVESVEPVAASRVRLAMSEDPTIQSHYRVIAPTTKVKIEQEARRCANDGRTRRDACPWPYSSVEGQHWTAVFLLAGGKLG